MKFSGMFEINGITRLVVNQTTVWLREVTRSGQIVWRLEHTERRKPDRAIVGKIQHFINDEEYNVWFHNETCNVSKIAQVRELVEMTIQPRKSMNPVLKQAHVVAEMKHGSPGTNRHHR